jgi:Protein of unknown function (DUF3761)/Protein of unknown function (DUF1524)
MLFVAVGCGPGVADNRISSGTPPKAVAPTPTASASKSAVPHETPGATGRSTALALLATLAVKGRAPMTGYDRAEFGAAWTDTNRNGCDTRNDVLRRDLTRRQVKPGTSSCVALGGWLAPDPYTGSPIHFVYGGASEVDIDHVVALGDAWQTGAFQWVPLKRLALANDPMNLLAVSSSANRSKGDGDAASWLPSNKSYRCAYVARQVAVKAKYGLWVTAAERNATVRILDLCPRLVAPTGTAPTISPVRGSQPATRSTTKSTSPKPGTGGASAVCNDGTLSYSAHRSGTCSGHGGVRKWLKDLP